MTATQLVETFGVKGRWDPRRGDLDELARRAAAVFDLFDPDEAAAVYVDASEIAAALDRLLGVRRLAATVARAAESRCTDGVTDWDRALDWIEAAEKLASERTNHARS